MVRRGLPEMIPVNLNDTIHGALDLAAVEIETNRIEVELNLASSLPAITGDRVQLQQLFLNIVLNAIEAMRDVGPVRKLRVRSYGEARQIIVEVEDTGPGIPAEIAERLFEAFVTMKEQGMGLGLSICRTIVEGHGGSIAAIPASGSGAIFRLVFPAGAEAHG
jgi:signal transduction histidine kinase